MLLKEIISKSNMQVAYRQVTGNNGAAGVDGIGAAGFPGQLKPNGKLSGRSLKPERISRRP